MAEFCKQCSEELFGKDFGDLKDITKQEDVDLGMYCVVICEGCGITQVDPDGKCVCDNCLKNHGLMENK